MKRGTYIVSPLYDWAFFLLPPTVAMLAGALVFGTGLSETPFTYGAEASTGSGFLIGVLIHAHLVAVIFRSHANLDIFRLHPIRFVVVPIALYAALVLSDWVAVAAMIVATFWDVWHSGAQTFGFARIYDRNRGTAPDVGRWLDFALNQLLYAGPMLAGAVMMDHVAVFSEMEGFEDPVALFFARVPADVEGHARILTWTVIGGGLAFLALYVLAYLRLWRRGYRPAWQKVFLLVTTGLTSIVTWGFNPWGEAFFIMNAFHGVQYLALVWATEGERMTKRIALSRFSFGKALTLALYLGAVVAYGAGVELMDPDNDALWSITMVVSLMHFWYDAFIWSVRKKQV